MQKLTSTQCQSVRNTAKTPVEVQKEKNYYNFEKIGRIRACTEILSGRVSNNGKISVRTWKW